MSRRPKKVTSTSLVLEQLRACDDFMDHNMLIKATGEDCSHVSAALHHLRKHRAADCVVNPDGKAWWFALPPEDDDRSRTCTERAIEGKRKPRKTRKAMAGK